jgi:hypothetical protein
VFIEHKQFEQKTIPGSDEVKRKLQVFVSSTFSDLTEERQAAVAAILKAGHIPAGMELFTAGDKSQMTTIERWIDERDVYMLILGGRYGSIESTSGLSYTELEYDYAREHAKPSFAVVITEEALESKVKSGGTKFIEKNEPKALAQFRAKVLSNISSFFSDAKDVRLCVYESLSDLAVDPALKGWVAADEVQDNKVLNEEIKKLRTENASLTEALRKLEAATAASRANSSNSNEELIKVLRAIQIDIPANLNASGEESSQDLYSIAYANKDHLINGCTDAERGADLEHFFYFKIFPKLQAHGLADNEKVPGVRYRRSFLNRAGRAFFADIERRLLLSKTTINESGAATSVDIKPQDKKDSEDKPIAAAAKSPREQGTSKKKKAS